MSHTKQLDHIGVTVADLDAAAAFFVGLGLEIEGRAFLEGEFTDTVIGIPDSRSEINMLRPPGGGTGVELARFVRPHHEPGSPTAMATELGLRNIGFEVGEVGEYENIWRMAHVRGPEGIVVSLSERIG